MQNKKLYATVLVLVVFVAIFTLSPAISSLMDTVVMRSTGNISTKIFARSGSAGDIQAAVDAVAAAGGGTVFVPAGTFYWTGQTVTMPNGGVNIIGASPAGCKGHEDNWEHYTATTILHNTQQSGFMFAFGKDYTHGEYMLDPIRVSGIQFEADAPTNPTAEDTNGGGAISLKQIPDFRVDHCTFINFPNIAVAANAADGFSNVDVSCYGVIDHCVVDNQYKLTPDNWTWGYGIYSIGNGHDPWISDITLFRGQYGHVKGATIVYIEDNHLSRCRHSFDAMANGYYVARFNLIDNPSCIYPAGMINDHGAAFPGARGYEAYSNTLVGLPAEITWQDNNNLAIVVRGGSAIITDNTYTDDINNPYSYFVQLSTGDNVVGKEEQSVSDAYIWGNSYEKCSFLQAFSGINENEHYFLRAPNQQQDGFTYTPYPYPHPLTLETTP